MEILIHTHCINQWRKKGGSVHASAFVCIYTLEKRICHVLTKTWAISCNIIVKFRCSISKKTYQVTRHFQSTVAGNTTVMLWNLYYGIV